MTVILNIDSLQANSTLGAKGRVLATPFQVSVDRPAFVSYTIQLSGAATANLTAGRVELRSDAANPPLTVQCQMRMNFKTTGTLTTMQQIQEAPLTYIVPKGFFVNLVLVTESGVVTASITQQSETIL